MCTNFVESESLYNLLCISCHNFSVYPFVNKFNTGYLVFMYNYCVSFVFTDPETASRVGGVGVRKDIRPQNIRFNTSICHIAYRAKTRDMASGISGKPSNPYCSAEK